MGKKGLSSVVSNMLIILIILVSIGIIWVALGGILSKTLKSLSTSQYTLDLKINSASLNITSGIASVKVFRDTGEGELVGIKFIFEDKNTGNAFDKRFLKLSIDDIRSFSERLANSDPVINLNWLEPDIVPEITFPLLTTIFEPG